MILTAVLTRMKTLLLCLCLLTGSAAARISPAHHRSSQPTSPKSSAPPAHIYIAQGEAGGILRVDDMTGKHPIRYGEHLEFLHDPDPKTNGLGQFKEVTTVCLDKENRIYMLDGIGRLCRMDDMTGKNWTVLPLPGAVSVAFVDDQDRIYILGTPSDGRHIVHFTILRVDDMTGKNPLRLECAPPTVRTVQSVYPAGLFVDKHHRIYVADEGNGCLLRAENMTAKTWTTYVPKKGFYPDNVFVDDDDKIYLVERRYLGRMDDMTGKNWTVYRPRNDGRPFEGMLAVWVDARHRIYVAETIQRCVARFDDMQGKNFTVLDHISDPRCIVVR